MLSKKDLEHLAALARLDFKDDEGTKLRNDLGNILDYFKELQGLDTSGVEPMTGGTELKNVVREDVIGKTDDTGKGPEAFPDRQDGYLRVPPVF